MRLPPTSGAVLALALVLIASLLLPCFDFCPDDDSRESCPPVCVSCAGCPRLAVPVPTLVDQLCAPAAAGSAAGPSAVDVMPLLTDDILHVPLAFVS